MATSFKQVANNAQSTAVSGAFNNTTSPLTFSVQSGHGARFPSPGNGFYLTVWNSASYPDPFSDPNMEIVLCTARTTDSLTVTRGQRGTTATAKTGSPDVRLLIDSTHISDLATAVNTLETAVGGLVIKSGSATPSSNVITFGYTFASKPVVVASINNGQVNIGGGNRGITFDVQDADITTTQFKIRGYRADDGSSASVGIVQWIAIGT